MRECNICYRPVKWNYSKICNHCAVKIKKDGYAHYRIRLGEVGSDTVNYQQHLHRKFFGCNAPVKYRGIKENRVYNSLEPEFIYLQTKVLKKTLTVSLPTSILWLFKSLDKSINNFTKRLLYNATLYFIHYHIEKPSKYESEDHFKSSLIITLINHILKTFVRTNEEYRDSVTLKMKVKKAKDERTHLSFSRMDSLYSELCVMCGEVVSTLRLN